MSPVRVGRSWRCLAGSGLGMLADEPNRGSCVGPAQGRHERRPDGADVAVMDVKRGVHPDPAVAVVKVVPAAEYRAERPGVLEATEPIGEVVPGFRVLDCTSK